MWHNLHTSWSAADCDLVFIRLESTDMDGLNIPPIQAAYMIQYRNSLTGKHFKTLMQTMVFHVHGIFSDEQFTLIKAMGSLGALLWDPQIENMDEYLVCVLMLLVCVSLSCLTICTDSVIERP